MSRLVAITAGAILLAAIVAGILTVGGPGTARLHRQDEERLDDLITLESHVLCHARSHNGELPTDLTIITGCVASPPLSDPFTEEPYPYSLKDDASFSICATFNNLDRAEMWAGSGTYSNFNRELGCVISRFER